MYTRRCSHLLPSFFPFWICGCFFRECLLSFFIVSPLLSSCAPIFFASAWRLPTLLGLLAPEHSGCACRSTGGSPSLVMGVSETRKNAVLQKQGSEMKARGDEEGACLHLGWRQTTALFYRDFQLVHVTQPPAFFFHRALPRWIEISPFRRISSLSCCVCPVRNNASTWWCGRRGRSCENFFSFAASSSGLR